MVRILIVDDDEAIREMLHMMFECVGYDVIEAASGIEALEILRTSSDQLVVLLDMLMPRLNGLGVLQIIASDEQLSAKHGFILITASRDLSALNLDETVMALSVPVVSKPFAMSHLIAVVDNVVECLQPVTEPVISQ